MEACSPHVANSIRYVSADSYKNSQLCRVAPPSGSMLKLQALERLGLSSLRSLRSSVRMEEQRSHQVGMEGRGGATLAFAVISNTPTQRPFACVFLFFLHSHPITKRTDPPPTSPHPLPLKKKLKKTPTAATLTVSALKLNIPHVVTSFLVPPQQT